MTNHIHIHVGKTKDSASSATKGKVFTALGYVQDATKAIRTIEDEDKAVEDKLDKAHSLLLQASSILRTL